MRVLLVGSGGREHALAWKIAQSPLVSALLAAPGSDAIAAGSFAQRAAGERSPSGLARCFPAVAAADVAGIVALARAQAVDLVVVGPEDPLVAGLADRLREAGIAVFGPSAAAARLEGSKSFAKAFMQRHRIPSAGFAVFDDLAAARAHVGRLAAGCVVKADGLAAGKGVAVCESPEQALAALDEAMRQRRFGAAGDRVVIEERLFGEEASYYAITDGEHVVALAAAQDHKRIGEGDRGENTGGMGAYAPAPVVDAAVEKKVLERIVYPAIRGLAAEGTPYRGVLFVGLMIDAAGDPRVVEFNVRFGDPETQPLVMQVASDLVPLRPLNARSRPTASSLRASAPSPQTVSVGYASRPPSAIHATACSSDTSINAPPRARRCRGGTGSPRRRSVPPRDRRARARARRCHRAPSHPARGRPR